MKDREKVVKERENREKDIKNENRPKQINSFPISNKKMYTGNDEISHNIFDESSINSIDLISPTNKDFKEYKEYKEYKTESTILLYIIILFYIF